MARRKNAPRFPKHQATAKRGLLGLHLVQDVFQHHYGWIVRPTPQETDFGIDAQVEIVTPDGSVTGRQLGVQIKCGRSYLKASNSDGFIYTGRLHHLNYYLNQPIPVLLILCDPRARRCWWEHIRPETTERTRSGWRITVPYEQELGHASRSYLEALAGEARDFSPDLEHLWQMNSLLTKETGLIIMDPSREAIEQLDISHVVSAVNRLSLSKELLRNSRGRITWGVSGYDDDPRELYEIPEFRQWVRQLETAEIPWFWFMNPDPKAAGLLLLMLGSCAHSRDKKGIKVNLDDQRRFLEEHFSRLNSVAAFLSLPDKVLREISEQIFSYFSAHFRT